MIVDIIHQKADKIRFIDLAGVFALHLILVYIPMDGLTEYHALPADGLLDNSAARLLLLCVQRSTLLPLLIRVAELAAMVLFHGLRKNGLLSTEDILAI